MDLVGQQTLIQSFTQKPNEHLTMEIKNIKKKSKNKKLIYIVGCIIGFFCFDLVYWFMHFRIFVVLLLNSDASITRK